MKRTIKDWLMILVLLLDEAVALALVLFLLWFFRISVSPPIAIVMALLLGTIAFISHKVIIPSFHKKQVTGSEGMIGLEAEVVEALTPAGVVRVTGEYWKAKSVGDDIVAGTDVEILGLNGLVLEVKRKGQ
jgi:membrane-bound ClpP family serine protease